MIKIIATILLSLLLLNNKANAGTNLDDSAGKRAYAQCMGCHSPEYHRTGPKHCGLLGRQAGVVLGFKFTLAMKNSGIIWTVDNLDLFLENPLAMVPKTSMGFSGIKSKKIRMQLIAYLATLNKENVLCK